MLKLLIIIMMNEIKLIRERKWTEFKYKACRGFCCFHLSRREIRFFFLVNQNLCSRLIGFKVNPVWTQVAGTFAPLSLQLWALASSLRDPGVPPSIPPSLPPSLPSLSPPRPTSKRRSASRVFLLYKFSSRGANRSTPISAIISDSNYLQIHGVREKYCSRPGPKTLYFHLPPIDARNFYALKREILGDAPALLPRPPVSVWTDKVCPLRSTFEIWTAERTRTALSPEPPYLVR